MIIRQDKETENLLEITKEINELYSGYDVSFDKTYMAFDGYHEWVDPSTTKKVFDKILKNISYKPEDVLIDCGSGLGHVLYLSSFHFNKVIGIEILVDVAKECEKNLITLMGKKTVFRESRVDYWKCIKSTELLF